MSRLTQGAAIDTVPAISRDGKRMVYSSNRSGKIEIWTRDFESGREAALVPARGRPTISGDGSTVAYSTIQPASIYVVPYQGGTTQKVCDDCFLPWDLSSDGKKVLYWWDRQRRVGLIDVSSGQKIDLLHHPEYAILRSHFSPDDLWIAFHALGKAGTPLFIAPFRGTASGENDWIRVTDGTTLDNVPRWSPDGNQLYFTSERDGFRCIWKQPLDEKTRKPRGPAVPLHHFHNVQRSLSNVNVIYLEISVARDKIVFPLSERSGNIWMAELSQNRK
jgi:Tol biopolymer transport system component